MKKVGTVALVIQCTPEAPQTAPVLLETLSDQSEIVIFEDALTKGETDPLSMIQSYRSQQSREEEEFGDYVEDLLTKPWLRTDVREHGVQWFKSKVRIEKFRRMEAEATHVIAQYAYEIFSANPQRTDFILAGPNAEVRIRVFKLVKKDEQIPEVA